MTERSPYPTQRRGSPIARADMILGRAVELAVERKHRRRLRRLGHENAVDPSGQDPWAAGDPSPRPGTQLEVLVDGARAMPAIAQALQGARSHVHITGWHLAAHFELVRGEHPVVLGMLLAELAQRIDVRVLVWAGSPLPAFHPTRKEISAEVERLVRGTQIRCERDPREHPFHCHHEKTVVVDDDVAFVGGIDMTDFGGDRFDLSEHPARGQLGRLIAADAGNGRLPAATLRLRTGNRTDPLYVHAKVCIVDDGWLTIGNANLNAHSLTNDTEMNVVTDDHELARQTRERLWAEHLELGLDAVTGRDPRTLVDEYWIPGPLTGLMDDG